MLPLHWPVAVERFAASNAAAEIYGARFRDLFATVKRSELNDFASFITPVEYDWYLPAL